MPSLSSPKDRLLPRGFTLVELLISLGIGLLVLGATAFVITSHIRSTAASERSQRVRDDANRLNYFLQVEAGEAARIRQNVAISQCSGAGIPSSSLFTLDIPLPTGTAGDPTSIISVHYYNKGSDFARCGPSVNRNGSLNFSGGFQERIVSSATRLDLKTNLIDSCQGVITTSRAVAYQANYLQAGAIAYQPPCEVARAKSFFVAD
ncbi:MAG: prepilin-type N-terminal cleavage/methylation domain-containing protein [Cyanobacteriota bacterium]|jgi:prepilin-type N-terminal cleavage/methylation domain-containing protein